MAKNDHTMHLRLSPEQIRKFETFHRNNFAGLPASLIARLLLADQLEKSDQDLIAIILKHIQGRAAGEKHGANRLGLESNKRKTE